LDTGRACHRRWAAHDSEKKLYIAIAIAAVIAVVVAPARKEKRALMFVCFLAQRQRCQQVDFKSYLAMCVMLNTYLSTYIYLHHVILGKG